MGNLFIGFPVPRAKIATMIEEAAPPLDHVSNHLPDGTDPIADPGDISNDQILQWDGTKFIGTAAPTEGVAQHVPTHEPDGTDPIVLPGDITTDQLLKWNGTKFIGSAAPAASPSLSPMSIHPSQFHPCDDQQDFILDYEGLTTRTSMDPEYYYAPVLLPHGVTVTTLTLFSFRDDASAYSNLYFYRVSDVGQEATMATCPVDWTNGNGTKVDTSIQWPDIDNNNYSYVLRFYMHCNDSLNDLKLYRVQIDFE